jgi:putative Mg2+ transporter-C (MgtC) family protein
MSQTLCIPLGEIALRLGLAASCGVIVGLNRGAHGRAAGLRTMMLVCTGAALAMVTAQTILLENGGPGSAAVSEPSRWAQGILAGMGFLGAGAILRKGNIIRGVTTAAALWYVTILGLCFGLGYLWVGLVAAGFLMFCIFVVPYAEQYVHSDRYCKVTVTAEDDCLLELDLCRRLESLGICVEGLSIRYRVKQSLRTIQCAVRYHVKHELEMPTRIVAELSALRGVVEVRWK